MEQYRTVFPPLLISMQQHLALVRELARSVATARVDGPLESAYWDWVRTDAGGLARALRNPELQRTWDDLGRVHGELLVVAESCLSAVAADDGVLAQRCLDQVFDYLLVS